MVQPSSLRALVIQTTCDGCKAHRSWPFGCLQAIRARSSQNLPPWPRDWGRHFPVLFTTHRAISPDPPPWLCLLLLLAWLSHTNTDHRARSPTPLNMRELQPCRGARQALAIAACCTGSLPSSALANQLLSSRQRSPLGWPWTRPRWQQLQQTPGRRQRHQWRRQCQTGHSADGRSDR